MKLLHNLLTNPFLITAASSWAAAQMLKVILHALIHKQLRWERLFGDGGMPSGHSATVSSLAVMTALLRGAGSFEFALSAVFALVVCHDAMGVRQETGKQAVVINEIVKTFSILTEKSLPEVKLKELVGHTPIQVGAGIGLGVGNAFLIYGIMM